MNISMLLKIGGTALVAVAGVVDAAKYDKKISDRIDKRYDKEINKRVDKRIDEYIGEKEA